MYKLLNGLIFKQALISGANNIVNHRQEVDALNVFPVPDGDTGTNMSMTISAASRELQVSEQTDIAGVSAKAAAALLRGARGNSGVILSLIFRGISNGFKGMDEADGKALARALELGKESAYKAVMKPTEGTILTVIRMAAEAVKGTEETDCKAVLETAYEAAKVALMKTPDMLPVLKEAGVVDAGGQGFIFILEGMLSVIADGKSVEPVETLEKKDAPKTDKSIVAAASGDIKFGYCSEFLINREKNAQSNAAALKAYLESIGDCVVVVEDEDIIKVHVHSNEPGNVIQAALKCGPLTNIKIDNMRFQHRNAELGTENAKSEVPQTEQNVQPVEPTKDYGFVSVAAGDGFVELFRELGADNIVSGGQTMNPSTDDILSAIEATPARRVFVLPNNKNIIMAAEQTVNLADRKVSVLQTKTLTQGVSAMLNFSETEDVETNLLNMMKAAEAVHTAQVTFAARDSEAFGQRIKKGQILGMEDGKITLVEDDIVNAAFRTARRLVKKYNGSFITVYYGEETDEVMANLLNERLAERFPNAEINVIPGGQPVYYFIISVE